MRPRLAPVGAAVALAAIVGAHSVAASPAPDAGAEPSARSAPVSSARAASILRRAEGLLDQRRRTARGDLTLALLRLVRAYPALDADARDRADRLLARPSDRRDPLGDSWSAPEAPASPACSTNFCVHWVERTRDAPSLRDRNGFLDGDRVPDYVEVNLFVAEQAFSVENVKLRWRQPKSDRRKGGARGKTDVYLADVGGAGLFGYAAPDREQARPGGGFPRSLYSYLVMDDDYNRRQFPGTNQLDDLTVTLAHEYNHVLQFSYDVYQDVWMLEATAVWMEDKVYDVVNDYLRYMRRWAKRQHVPLTASSIKVYGSVVWNVWLEQRYGADVIRRAWAGTRRARPVGFSVASYGRAIRGAGRSTFNRDFARFSRDVAEWRTATVFPEGRSFPDLGRSGRLRSGRAVVRRLNHTTFKLLAVRPVRARAVRVTLRVPGNTAAALALVGRIGGERRGRVVSRLRFKRRGGRISLALGRPGRFNRLTAVIVNADTKQRGFSNRRFDWLYTRNRVPFTVTARLIG
jgi:Family of unknown function (DUF6055)